jgi:hypothetical protein
VRAKIISTVYSRFVDLKIVRWGVKIGVKVQKQSPQRKYAVDVHFSTCTQIIQPNVIFLANLPLKVIKS